MKKNGKKFGAGHLEVISLADLRTRVKSVSTSEKNSFVHMHQAGDVEKHLTDPTNLYQDKRSKFFQDKRSESKNILDLENVKNHYLFEISLFALSFYDRARRWA